MVGIDEVHNHGADIIKAGFSVRKAADATAMEAPPYGSPELKHAIDVNNSLAQGSGGRLPLLNPDRVRYLAVGGNHTNCFLRAAAAGCKTNNPDISNCTGVIDKSLFIDQPALTDAMNEGLTWTVISHQVEMHAPGVVDFVHAAAAKPTAPRDGGERRTAMTSGDGVDMARSSQHFAEADAKSA